MEEAATSFFQIVNHDRPENATSHERIALSDRLGFRQIASLEQDERAKASGRSDPIMTKGQDKSSSRSSTSTCVTADRG